MLYLAVSTTVATRVIAHLVLGCKITAIKELRESKTQLVAFSGYEEATRMDYRLGLGEAKLIVDSMLQRLKNIPLCSGFDFRVNEALFPLTVTQRR